MSTRKSKAVVQAVTKERFETALADYARADAKASRVISQMDLEVTKIREKYSEELTGLQKDRDQAFEVVQTYCMENQEPLFSKKKSMDTVHGTVGFRTGNLALKTKKGFTWAAVLELVKVKLPGYVRKKEELDKESLLANRDTAEVAPLLSEVGVTVSQEERFFIELKKEELSEA